MWKSFLVKFSFQFAAHIYLWRKEEEIFNCFYQCKSFASRKKHNVRLILVQLVFYINIHSVFPPCVTHMSFIVWPVPLLDHCHHHHHNQHPNRHHHRHHHQHHHHHHMQIMFSSISPLQVSLASYCEAHLYIIGLSNWHCPISRIIIVMTIIITTMMTMIMIMFYIHWNHDSRLVPLPYISFTKRLHLHFIVLLITILSSHLQHSIFWHY